jgi:AIG2-like family.
MADLVFVYGTLTDDEQVATLLDSYRFISDAVCTGLRRVDGRYPTLVPGESVTGRLLETDEIDRLDRYEGVERGLYHRLPVSLDPPVAATTATTTASVYLAAPNAVGLGSLDRYWPDEGCFADRVDNRLASTTIRPISENG